MSRRALLPSTFPSTFPSAFPGALPFALPFTLPVSPVAATLLAALVALTATYGQAWAQDSHAGHEHPMRHEQDDRGDVQTQNEGQGKTQPATPPEMRDPHAYSDGYVLGRGAYALGEQRQLHLADEHNFGGLRFDNLEYVNARESDGAHYDMQAWFGRTYDRFLLKAEGDVARGRLHDSRTELLWAHAVASYWDIQSGVRHDYGNDNGNRTWLAFGVQGLAPYWFHVDATAYLSGGGRAALRLEADYDLLLTQKLILQPRVEGNFYSKSEPERGIGKGLADASAGMRLRYELSRQFAPYIGVEWKRKFSHTASLAEAAGERVSDTRWVAGVRFWF